MIEVQNVSKRFGRLTAVDDLSFVVCPGHVTGFLGPNGAGKTTTVRILLGLVHADSGIATILGKRYRDLAQPSHAVGAALEAATFHPGRTARDHLRVRAVAGRIAKARIEEVLELVELADAEDRRISGFSLGMRQRLGLAAALLGDPPVLILDEPTNGMDPEGIRWLRRFLRSLASEGRAILVSSHVLAETAQTVDHVVVINNGHLVTESTLADLTAQGPPVMRIRTPSPTALQAVITAEGGHAQLTSGDRIEVTGVTPARVADLAAKLAIPVIESVVEQASLEDVFLRLTNNSRNSRDGETNRDGRKEGTR